MISTHTCKPEGNRKTSSSKLSAIPILIPPFLRSLHVLHPILTLPLYPRHVLLRHGIPRTHVLLHAAREARLLALGQRGVGFRHAALETVLVQLLDEQARILHRSFLLDLAHDLRFAANISVVAGNWGRDAYGSLGKADMPEAPNESMLLCGGLCA
jgi:hypothetical protein